MARTGRLAGKVLPVRSRRAGRAAGQRTPREERPGPAQDKLDARWCGYCIRLKSQLSEAGIGFQEIDIEDHADGAAVVAQVNDGNLTVPTVLFRDGSALTNPSAAQVGSRLP